MAHSLFSSVLFFLAVYSSYGANVTSLEADNGVILISYTIDSSYINFVLNGSVGTGWYAIGINDSPQMPGAEIIWVRNDPVNGVQVTDAFAGGYSTPTPDIVTRLFVSNRSIVDTSLNVVVKRPLNKTDSSDVAIKIDGSKQYIIWAHGRSQRTSFTALLQHTQAGILEVNFQTGTSSGPVSAVKPELWQVHGILMFVSWGILIPLGVVTARYGREFKYWFITHRTIQIIGVLLLIAGFVVSRVMRTGNRPELKTHGKIGLAILILGISQAFFALLRPHDKKSTIRRIWFFSHFGNGIGLLVLSWVNIVFGLDLYDSPQSLQLAFKIYIIVFSGIIFILEIVRIVLFKEKKVDILEMNQIPY